MLFRSFSYFKAQGCFVIKDDAEQRKEVCNYNTSLCLHHSHPVQNVCLGVNNTFLVSKRDDATLEEIQFIRQCAELHCTIPQAADGLRRRFGKANSRTYEPVFVKNQLNTARDEIFGKDRHRMKELMEHGLQTRKRGGVWETDVSDTFMLSGVRYQSPFMRQLAVQYGCYFFTCDGTYGTNQYGLTMIPLVTVDCNGFSHCCGVIIALSERSADVVKGCQSFLLSSVLNESEEVNVSIVFCCSSFVVLFHTNSHSFSHFVLWGHSLMKWLMALLLITMSSRIAVEVVCSLTMDHSALHQLQH